MQRAQPPLTRWMGSKPCCAVQRTRSLQLVAMCGALKSTLVLQVLPLIDDLLSGLTGKHDVVEVVKQMLPQLLRLLHSGSSQRQVLDLLGTLLEQIPQLAVRVQLRLMCHAMLAGMNGLAQLCLPQGLLAHTHPQHLLPQPHKFGRTCVLMPARDPVTMTLPDRLLASWGTYTMLAAMTEHPHVDLPGLLIVSAPPCHLAAEAAL